MIDVRPQPVGVFPWPASHLLLPPVTGSEVASALAELGQGGVGGTLPAEWQFFELAALGEVDQANSLLENDPSPIARYNRFVLVPTPEAFQAAAESVERDAPLRELLGVAAYSAGVVDDVAQPESLDGELLALALATDAAAALEFEQPDTALKRLISAVEAARPASPLFAAVLLAQAADIKSTMPNTPPGMIIQDYQQAMRLADGCRRSELMAELSLKLGMAWHNAANGQRGVLLEAVKAYQGALHRGITRETHPLLFAQIQTNLGLAYLAIPPTGASHQLKSGIAIQSFRRALDVYTVDEHPDLWASVSMNLANALQYAPSSHVQDNLIQAVEIYEQVLQVRTRARDPVAYALVLMNQANALAHLGVFKPALEKLAEAYKLFHWYDKLEQANAARELVEQINQLMGDQGKPVELTSE